MTFRPIYSFMAVMISLIFIISAAKLGYNLTRYFSYQAVRGTVNTAEDGSILSSSEYKYTIGGRPYTFKASGIRIPRANNSEITLYINPWNPHETITLFDDILLYLIAMMLTGGVIARLLLRQRIPLSRLR